MDLADAASYFDDIPLRDAYTNALLSFKGQFSTFNETDPDGSVSTSRTLSVVPTATMPTRRVITLMGETWLLGDSSQDGIYGEAIRQNLPMRRVTDLFTVATPGQIIAGTGGTTAYGRKDYLMDKLDSGVTAGYYPFYNLFFTSAETAPATGMFFKTALGLVFRCRSAYAAKDGMICAQCDLIGGESGNSELGLTWANFGTGAYDPITDSYPTPSDRRDVLALLPHQLYAKNSQADPAYQPGDLTLLVRLTSGTVQVGQPLNLQVDRLTWASSAWGSGLVPARVVSITPELDTWSLHVRRA